MNDIQITDIAAIHIKKKLEKTPEYTAIRLSIKPSGCNGYSYHLDPATSPTNVDFVIQHNGAMIIVDPKSGVYLGDVVIDYKTVGLNSGFDIQNSIVDNQCGCGESFSIK